MPAAGACPPDMTWYEIAAGARSGAAARAWLEHAAACARCGPRLAGAIADLKTAEAPRRPARNWWPASLAAAALLAIAIGGSYAYWRYQAQHAPAALLARAYSAHRTLALRLQGAAYAPLTTERGGAAARPPELLEAEDRIAHALERAPNSAIWLDLQARADLLEWNYAAALAHAQRGLLGTPHSAPLLGDLAAAYFERGEAAGDALDYDAALDALGRALSADSRDLTARFNRALVAERLLLYPQAIRDWQNYLRQDATSGWAAVARRHLAADETAVENHDRSYARPLLAASAYVEAAARGDPSLAGRDEDYLERALIAWLPAAFPATFPTARPRAQSVMANRRALQALASRLALGHQDQWLSDLLAEARRDQRHFAAGVGELARAEKANRGGDPADGARLGARAAGDFASGAEAGAARAGLAEVYGLDRQGNIRACSTQLPAIVAAAARHGWHWIGADALLEQANCRASLVDFEGAQAAIARAAAIATAARYPSVGMRARAFLAADVGAPPDAPPIWQRHRALLASYWEAPMRPMWGYQLYMTLAIDSADLGRPHAALAFARGAADRIAHSPERSFQALAWRQVALYAAASGRAELAEAAMQRAKEAFRRLPPTAATANFESICDLELAAEAVQAGAIAQAGTDLARYRQERGRDAKMAYWDELAAEVGGEVALGRGRPAEAAREFETATRLNDEAMARLGGNRQRASWEERHLTAYRGLVEATLETAGPRAALELWERARGGALAAPRWSLQGGLASLRGAQAVSYAAFARGLAIWRYDDRGVEVKRLAVSEAQLRAAARAFAASCANPGGDPALLRAQARQLYEWLIAPIAAGLDAGRELIIEPDEALGQVPFAALVGPDGRWLGERFVLRYSPGLAWAAAARAGGAGFGARTRMLAVGDPALGTAADRYPPLPMAAEEARRVAARFRRARVLTGAQATRAAVLTALPSAEIFHFAGHAEVGVDQASLLLAGRDGPAPLAAALLKRKRLAHCRLAVLAACATARGSAVLLDPNGLVRALLRAGVPSVVASLWAVDSASTAALSAGFYAALLKGSSPALSIHQAEAAMRRQPRFAAPYYWAGFALFDARP